MKALAAALPNTQTGQTKEESGQRWRLIGCCWSCEREARVPQAESVKRPVTAGIRKRSGKGVFQRNAPNVTFSFIYVDILSLFSRVSEDDDDYRPLLHLSVH